MARLLLVNARIATMRGGKYSIVEKGAMRVEDGRITAIDASGPGPPANGSPGQARSRDDVQVIDARGALVTPGLIDLHTHVYAGLSTGRHADHL